VPLPGGWQVALIAAWSLLISRAKGRRSQTGTESAGAHRAGLTQDHRVSDIIREVMSPYPRALNPDATVLEAAEVMRRDDIGDVRVMAEADPAELPCDG
jgi:hypothetical protein